MIRYRRDFWRLLMGLPRGDAAEIGVAEGRFSLEMLQWPVDFHRVYMVDAWREVPGQRGDASSPQAWHDENMASAMEKVAPFKERAVVLRGDTVEMAQLVPDGSLVFVFIDADHSLEGATRDIEAWWPKLIQGGYMVCHDYETPQYGVHEAVQRFCNALGVEIGFLPEDNAEDAGAYFQKRQ